jgi:integrase
MKALSQDEILKVLRAASDSPRDLAMILIAFRHGMRASEVCGLEVKDVDMKNGEITIRRLKGSLKTTQPLADLQGQPLLSEKRVLRAWLTERGDHPSRYVFVSQKSGNCIGHSSIEFSRTQLSKPDCRKINGTLTASSILWALHSWKPT